MVLSTKHLFASAKSDGLDTTVIQPSNWNAEHVITLAAGTVLGRKASVDGAAEELPISVDATGQSMVPPSGTTDQRPAVPLAGMMRYNSTTGKVEVYTNAAWGALGSGAQISATQPTNSTAGDLWYNTTNRQLTMFDGTSFVTPVSNIALDVFSGTGSQAVYTLSADPGSKNNLSIFINSVYLPKSGYSILATALTFVVAPAAGFNNIEIEYLASTTILVPADASVTTAKIADGAVLTAKIGSGQVTGDKIAINAVGPTQIAAGSINVAHFAPAAVITAAEYIGNNVNDITIPTTAAVSLYAIDQANAKARDPANISAAIALQALNAIGTYGYFYVSGNGKYNAGDIIAGSNLQYGSAGGASFYYGGANPPGTWMAHSANQQTSVVLGLFRRVT